MATFAKTSFNAQAYAASRPTYPRQLFDFIMRYHRYGVSTHSNKKIPNPGWSLAVDLGCGTGQATVELSRFTRVIGVDPSNAMLSKARQYVTDHPEVSASKKKGKFEFVESPAEKLGFLQDNTVDLVIAAQAAHWLDWKKLWPELARVLRRHGTVAIWGYSEMRFTRYPSLTPLINTFMQGTDPQTSLGPYWQQPGRNIVENLLQAVPNASSVAHEEFYAEQRIYFSGPHHPSIPNPRQVILQKKMSWADFETYLRSFSSLHTFQAKHRDDAEHPEGDIVKRFIRDLKLKLKAGSRMREADSDAGSDSDSDAGLDAGLDLDLAGSKAAEEMVEIEWPLVLILAKRA